MKRLMLALGLVMTLVVSGCGANMYMTAINQCAGSWLQIEDGRGEVVVPKLKYNESEPIPLYLLDDQEKILVAKGFAIGTNYPLGTKVRRVYDSNSSALGPSEEVWEIDDLETSDYQSGGCRR